VHANLFVPPPFVNDLEAIVDQTAFLKDTPHHHPLLFKWSEAIIPAKFLLLLFIHRNASTPLLCLPSLEKFKMFHFLGILCVNTRNMVLGKAAVEATLRAIPVDGDFSEQKAEIAGDLANFEGHPQRFCALCGQSEGVRTCSKCHLLAYCSHSCQFLDWPTYKCHCAQLALVDANLLAEQSYHCMDS
jgi:hypothetical protein